MTAETILHRQVCQLLRYKNVMFNTDLSGLKLPMGLARTLPALRSHRGYPDLVIYERRGGFSGLFIELKAEGVKLYKRDGKSFATPHIAEQAEVLNLLRLRGFMAVFSVGFDDTERLINYYLNLEP